MASLQQIVRNLNAKPTSMSLNERFAMLSSARQQQQQQQPQQVAFQNQSPRGGWMPQMLPQSAPSHFTSPMNAMNGGMDFANRMAQARLRSANGGSPIGVISGVRRGGGPRRNQMNKMASPKQLRSPQMIQQQRMAQATLRRASAQNLRLAQQLLTRPARPAAAGVRMAQKLKKRSVLQRLGAKAGQFGPRKPLSAPAGLQRRSLGGLGSPRLRGRGGLGGRLGAKRLSLSQRLGPKKNSPMKQQIQQKQQIFKQNKQQGQQQQQARGNFNRRGRTFRRGGGSAINANNSPNPNLRYFSAPGQQQQQQQRKGFNNQGFRRGGRGGGRRGRGFNNNNNNQPNRGPQSKASLDAEMDSYWTTSN